VQNIQISDGSELQMSGATLRMTAELVQFMILEQTAVGHQMTIKAEELLDQIAQVCWH